MPFRYRTIGSAGSGAGADRAGDPPPGPGTGPGHGQRTDPVSRSQCPAEGVERRRVDDVDVGAGRNALVTLDDAVRLERLEEGTQPRERAEPPVLLRPVRGREVVRVTRGEPLRRRARGLE